MAKKIIYTDAIGYPERRNFIDLPHDKFCIQKRLNAFRIPNALYFKYYKRSNDFLLNSHFEPVNSQNLHHFFNTISFGKAPWVTTFETLLPRWGRVPAWLEEKGVELLAGDTCKKLIALSECTRAIQAKYLDKFPAYKDAVLAKTVVLHPPQKVLINAYEQKYLPDSHLVMTIVGADFFRKGGKEVLLVFDELLKRKAPVKLQIVSSLQYGDYASRTTAADKEQAFRIINKYPKAITLYKSLPNNEVLDLLRNSHLCLLPTYADTYGYSVLEAQAAGCPVISTDIRALPEINNNSAGWLISVAKDELGNADLTSLDFFSCLLQEKLMNIIESICNKPSSVRSKGELAVARIKEQHCPVKQAQKLEAIYARFF
ncbi:glycosyltransferase family 4 protein [Pontibacter silvestris]|uniref:Glycosyltransferase family 4 protein n=1 Tax=Pontibacter silvestris TaxID=2305183 RepID=A0ABW4WXB5_9BACT|nr:glycosyltransferase family 4 protein [Pontibacter silvestris]MCC9137334.1 glycosyltransferase family 4 protein [Pontibacter silvestris]